MIEQLVKEQDKWHRRYNDAIIEIAKLSAINRNLEDAIRTLIWERDCAMKDLDNQMNNLDGCEVCTYKNKTWCGTKCTWRGVPHDRNNQRRCL